MKDFIDIYIKSWNNQYALLGQVTSLFVFTKSYFDDKTLFVGSDAMVNVVIRHFVSSKSFLQCFYTVGLASLVASSMYNSFSSLYRFIS